MQEVILDKNPSGLKILINGTPDVKQIPKQDKDLVLSVLQKQIVEMFQKKRTKRP